MLSPKLLALPAVALMLTSATQSDIPSWQRPEVLRVDCLKARGTAFRVSEHVLLTVAHVTSAEGCTILGQPFKILSTHGDFAIIRSEIADNRFLRIDCGGFVKGHRYIAVGFARGLNTQTEIEMTAEGVRNFGQSLLSGVWTVIPGMSGGPVLDADTGRAVGTVNTYLADTGESGSVELKGESVCRSS